MFAGIVILQLIEGRGSVQRTRFQRDIPGADLSNGVFDCTKFRGADLVKLIGAWLRAADLTGANLFNVQFRERPALRFEKRVFACSYSKDGCLAIAAGRKIFLYNSDTLQEI